MITDIYRIKTMNSLYEIRVMDTGKSICRKTAREADNTVTVGSWNTVRGNTDFLEKLYIGPSFKIPGVALTSCVTDYEHLVASTEPKRRIGHTPGIAEAMAEVTDHIVRAARGEVR